MSIIQDDEALEQDLVALVFSECDVHDHNADEMRRGEPLIGPDSLLGLDSLDALEIAVAVEKKYGVRIAHLSGARRVLASLDTLITFVRENRTK